MSIFGSVFGRVFGSVFGSVGTGGTDDDLQAALDTAGNRKGIRLVRSMNAGLYTDYYVIPIEESPGRSRWVQVLSSLNTADKAAAIRAALVIPAQPSSEDIA